MQKAEVIAVFPGYFARNSPNPDIMWFDSGGRFGNAIVFSE
jgi:hypothetical protein